MHSVIFAERFVNDLASVCSTKVLDRILHNVELLQTVPEMGSANLPDSIRELFGEDVRKLSVAPFLVLYKVLPESEDVLVLGMVM